VTPRRRLHDQHANAYAGHTDQYAYRSRRPIRHAVTRPTRRPGTCPGILLVDDDAGSSYETYFATALTTLAAAMIPGRLQLGLSFGATLQAYPIRHLAHRRRLYVDAEQHG